MAQDHAHQHDGGCGSTCNGKHDSHAEKTDYGSTHQHNSSSKKRSSASRQEAPVGQQSRWKMWTGIGLMITVVFGGLFLFNRNSKSASVDSKMLTDEEASLERVRVMDQFKKDKDPVKAVYDLVRHDIFDRNDKESGMADLWTQNFMKNPRENGISLWNKYVAKD